MDRTVAEEYKSSLNDLNFNSKPLINMLTMLADENKKHAASIVKTIVVHINSVSNSLISKYLRRLLLSSERIVLYKFSFVIINFLSL